MAEKAVDVKTPTWLYALFQCVPEGLTVIVKIDGWLRIGSHIGSE